MGRREDVMKYFDEQREAFDARVNEGIEQNRKGDATLTVVGAPAGAVVEVEQINHAFRFGANIFMLDEMENDEKNKIYRERFAELFNLATVPFYWSDLEPEEGKPRFAADSPKIYRRPATDLCVDYCLENGIEPKCHCLNYERFTPSWVVDAEPEVFYAKLEKRMKEISERYADKIPTFEVTNEHFWSKAIKTNHYAKAYDAPDFVERSYKLADKYFPNNPLIINDFNYWAPDTENPRNVYYMLIENLLLKGCRVDSVGIQYHSFVKPEGEAAFAYNRYNPEVMYKMLDLYATLGRPLQITEMTLPSYTDDPEDEEIQALLARETYRMFFAHPAMEAIIYWNLVDGYAAFCEQGDMTGGENIYRGGLLRFDMSPKPVWYELNRLIHEEWHTREALGADGGKFRGFYGDYRVTVTMPDGSQKTETLTLKKGEENNWVINL